MVKFTKIIEELEIPSDVQITFEGKKITVKGKMGSVVQDFTHARQISIAKEDNKIILSADFPRRNVVAMNKTIKNVIMNMFLGVREGYIYKMKIVYSHFPITLEPPKKGSTEIVIKNFIGERAPRITHTIGDVTVEADKDEVIVKGCNKEHVGQTCANIQKRCRIRNKDKRVFQDGIYIFERIVGNQQLWTVK